MVRYAPSVDSNLNPYTTEEPSNPGREPRPTPIPAGESQGGGSIKLITKAKNIYRDSALAVFVGLLPFLGLIYILGLVQWYQFKLQIEAMHQSGDVSGEFAVDFSGTRTRLWVEVLIWPGIILLLFIGVRSDCSDRIVQSSSIRS